MKTTCEDECNGNREGDTLWKCQGFASNEGHSKKSVKGVKGQIGQRKMCFCACFKETREIINVAIVMVPERIFGGTDGLVRWFPSAHLIHSILSVRSQKSRASK